MRQTCLKIPTAFCAEPNDAEFNHIGWCQLYGFSQQLSRGLALGAVGSKLFESWKEKHVPAQRDICTAVRI